MDLVIDANVLFAALIKNNKTTELLFKDKFHLFAPEYLLEEFMNHREEIEIKSDRPTDEFFEVIEILKKRISFIPYYDFKNYINRAKQMTPDPDDTEYVALALSIKASIWSNDKALKKIHGITVYSTADLIKILIEV